MSDKETSSKTTESSKNFFQKLKGLFSGGKDGSPSGIRRGMQQYLESLSQGGRTRLLTILWGFCLVFVGVSVLSGSNPVRLLIPGLAFPMPIQDERPFVKMYGVSPGSLEVIPVSRRLRLPGVLDADVRALAGHLSRPVEIKIKASDAFNDLQPLPPLFLSLKKTWFLKKEGRLVVELRARTIDRELAYFARGRSRKAKKASRKKNKKSTSIEFRLADRYFRALTASVFSVKSEVTEIQYVVDGKSSSVKDIDFDFKQTYIR